MAAASRIGFPDSTFGGKPLSNREGKTDKIPHGVFFELTKLYYECAHAAYPAAMAALTAFAPPSRYLWNGLAGGAHVFHAR